MIGNMRFWSLDKKKKTQLDHWIHKVLHRHISKCKKWILPKVWLVCRWNIQSEIFKDMKISSFIMINLSSTNQVCIRVCVCVCVCICFTHTVNAFSCSWCGQMTLKKRYAARKDAVFSHGCCVVLYAMLTCSVVSDSLQSHGVHQASPSKGVLQARILEWVAMPSARGSSWPMGQTQVSRIAGVFFTSWATREAPINKECPLIIAIMNTVGIQEEFINFYIDQGKIYLVFKSLRPW